MSHQQDLPPDQGRPLESPPKVRSVLFENVPWNWRTQVFSVIMGVLWSIPVNLIVPAEYHLLQLAEYDLALWLFYLALLVASFLTLPVWCLTALRPLKSVRAVGLMNCIVYYLILAGLLFLAMSAPSP